jgi:hypothetical protein
VLFEPGLQFNLCRRMWKIADIKPRHRITS